MSIERYNVRAGLEIHLVSYSYGRTFVKHDDGSIFKRYVANIALVKFWTSGLQDEILGDSRSFQCTSRDVASTYQTLK